MTPCIIVTSSSSMNDVNPGTEWGCVTFVTTGLIFPPGPCVLTIVIPTGPGQLFVGQLLCETTTLRLVGTGEPPAQVLDARLPLIRLPPSAIVEYACAMSSGVTPVKRPPIVMAGFCDTSVVMPKSCA